MEDEKLLVTMDERRKIASDMSIEFGKQIKYRVIDLDKIVRKIRAERAKYAMPPYVEIRPISPDMHKIPSRSTTFQKDPVTGILYGIPIDQDDYGNMKWQKIQVSDNLTLNLDNINDAKIWAVIRFWPNIKGSPFQEENPYYEVYDPVKIAVSEIGEVEAMKKAFERIDLIENKPSEMVMFARYLGEDINDNANMKIIYNMLLRRAMKYPHEFNRKWTSKLRSYGERFATARSIGVITRDIDRGFVFRNISLGGTEEEVIRFLSEDSNVMNSINSVINETDKLINALKEEAKYNEKANKVTRSSKKTNKDDDDKDPEKVLAGDVDNKDDDFE